MARSYQVSCPPGGKVVVVDSSTKGGGPNVTIRNGSADGTLYLGGEENEVVNTSTSTLASGSGYALLPGVVLKLQLTGNEIVYGLGAGTTNTCTAFVFRTNGAF